VRPRLFCAVDDAHTAAANLLDQLVIAEGGRKWRHAGREPRTTRPDGGFTEHHLIDASRATLKHRGLFGDRVGHEHGGEEFAEISSQVGMIGYEPFQVLLFRAGWRLRQLVYERRQLLLLSRRQRRLHGEPSARRRSHGARNVRRHASIRGGKSIGQNDTSLT
jgi:hypothetical protein